MGLFLAAFIYIYSTDGTYDYSSTATIDAPPRVVYDAIADLNRFSQWEPWHFSDPTTTHTVSGRGVGATYAWKGDKVQQGTLTNLRLIPYSRIDQKLVFKRDDQTMRAANYWILEDLGGGKTQVTWGFKGRGVGFSGKLFAWFAPYMMKKPMTEGLQKLDDFTQTH